MSGDGRANSTACPDVAIAPNGDIFVADGVNSRIVKFSKDGLHQDVGARRHRPGGSTCRIRSCSTRRGDCWWRIARTKRIQLFDQDGRFLTEWKQFGEASGLFIKPDDTLYVTDWQEQKTSSSVSAKDGSIRAHHRPHAYAEGHVDKDGNIYAAETLPGKIGDMPTGSTIRKLVRH